MQRGDGGDSVHNGPVGMPENTGASEASGRFRPRSSQRVWRRSGPWMSGGTTREKGREETPRRAALREARRRRAKFSRPAKPNASSYRKIFSAQDQFVKFLENFAGNDGASGILRPGAPIGTGAGRLTSGKGGFILEEMGQGRDEISYPLGVERKL